MKWLVLIAALLFVGCDSIGLGGSYPSIYTKAMNECGCDGVMYIMKNTNQTPQKVTLVRVRQSGTAPTKRTEQKMTIQPMVEKKLGCSEINLFITGRTEYCDTHQSFYIKKYKEIKTK